MPARLLLPIIALALLSGGCTSSQEYRPGTLPVLTAENVWASIAAQLAGSRGSVRSIITSPAQDPHTYEPTPADARAVANARLVIANDIGYDPWLARLVAANSGGGRLVLSVGAVVGARPGQNPHRWYSPPDVATVASSITAALKRLDRAHSAYYDQRRTWLLGTAFKRYREWIASIKQRYSGVPVGASESIFALQAPALGLRLLTPPRLMNAVSEGVEMTAADELAAQRQIADRRIKLWIYNSQNTTPEIMRLNTLARSHGIPVATVTETLSPARTTFQQWQVSQLEQIARALRQATGR